MCILHVGLPHVEGAVGLILCGIENPRVFAGQHIREVSESLLGLITYLHSCLVELKRIVMHVELVKRVVPGGVVIGCCQVSGDRNTGGCENTGQGWTGWRCRCG